MQNPIHIDKEQLERLALLRHKFRRMFRRKLPRRNRGSFANSSTMASVSGTWCCWPAVHHQYCGQLGKQANCQVAVTLSIANHHASLPIAYRLYLPKEA